MQLMAKSVLADKFWIVEKDGQKVGTIRSNDAGVTLTMGVQKLAFKQMEELQQKVNVVLEYKARQQVLEEAKQKEALRKQEEQE